jgi:hypothetical protein
MIVPETGDYRWKCSKEKGEALFTLILTRCGHRCQGSVHERKEAVTLASDFMVIVHVREVPEHAPDQPENAEPQVGVTVRVTTVPPGKLGADGLLVTVPLPDPVLVTARV